MIAQSYITDIEQDGYLSGSKANEIKSISETNYYIVEVDGTKEKVENGEDVYLNIDVYKTGLFNTCKIESIFVTGMAK
ncbi:hypothetical protein NE686_17520 [Tissierella carlieri]|uniref:Uncharacterized protein n=2 Tax=Tissierella carlieri TaxID=689904 RepID=A0ABT1SEJ0_9FIRM|nr:hypothetical protein [Tissierella carlieri]